MSSVRQQTPSESQNSEALTNALSLELKTNANLEEKLKAAKDKVANLNLELTQKQSEYESAAKKAQEDYKKELDALIEASEKEIKADEQWARDKEGQLATLKQALADKKADKEKLRELEMKRDALTNQVNEMKLTCSSLTEIRVGLIKNRTRASKELRVVKAQNRQLQQRLALKQKEVGVKTELVTNAKKEHEQAKVKSLLLVKQLDDAKKVAVADEAELKQLQADFKAEKQRADEVKQNLVKMTAMVGELEAQLSDKNQQLTVTVNNIRDLDVLLKQQAATFINVNNERQHLEAAQQALAAREAALAEQEKIADQEAAALLIEEQRLAAGVSRPVSGSEHKVSASIPVVSSYPVHPVASYHPHQVMATSASHLGGNGFFAAPQQQPLSRGHAHHSAFVTPSHPVAHPSMGHQGGGYQAVPPVQAAPHHYAHAYAGMGQAPQQQAAPQAAVLSSPIRSVAPTNSVMFPPGYKVEPLAAGHAQQVKVLPSKPLRGPFRAPPRKQ